MERRKELDINTRLERAVQMIRMIEGRRLSVGDDNLGSNIERMVIDRELSDLESQIQQDPGVLAPYLSL
jgi:hypothetical protein